MSDLSNEILVERAKRLEELLYLSKDPLLEDIGKVSEDAEPLLKAHNSEGNLKPIDISVLGKSEEKLIQEILDLIESSLFTEKSGNKRKSLDLSSVAPRKKVKLIPDIKDSIKNDKLAFLNKDLADLDILSLPQHYPTAPHNVSSLAELYYLTQTLPLIKLLPGAHKALQTESFELALLEGKIAVLYSRIEELKRQGKWSLRQPIKYADPFVRNLSNNKPLKFHWDNLLREDKWLATDFKEQSKFKKACCITIAQAIQDYWTYGKEVACIKTKPIEHLPEVTEEEEPKQDENAMEVDAAAVPTESHQELQEPQEPSQEPSQEPLQEPPQEIANKEGLVDNVEDKEQDSDKERQKEKDKLEQEYPDAIDVGLLLKKPEQDQEEVMLQDINKNQSQNRTSRTSHESDVFKLHVDLNDMKKLDQTIIRNLPKFTAFDEEEKPNLGSQPLPPTDHQVVPASKLLYPFDEDDGFHKIVVQEKNKVQDSYSLPDYQKGLFGVQAHRRFNYLRPPKPPLIKNIEYRSPTIWLPQDDKHLIHYVAEFSFNWDLISEHLLSKYASMKRYESNIERRTPWQCFERYIQLNEKFQFSDMKGPSAYHAQQWLEQAHRAQSTTKRRISPLGIGNESIQRGHRRLRWASMFDAMRKCMRKRENQIAKLNSRKATDYTQQINNSNTKNDKVPTPAELSRLKYERDKSIQEAYLNQQATRNRMMAAVAQQQKQQAQQPSQTAQQQFPQQQSNQKGGALSPNSGMAQGGHTSPQTAQARLLQTNGSPTSNTPMVPQQGNVPQVPLDANGRPKVNGNPPYTQEQIQKLIQLQRQRKLMQGQYPQRSGQTGPNQMPNMPNQGNSNGSGTNSGAGSGATGVNSGGNGANVSSPGVSQQSPQLTRPGNSMIGTRAPPVNANMNQRPPQQSPPTQQVQPSNGSNGNKPRIHFAPAQVSAIINSIQTKNPNLSKEQVTKLAASYLANLQQQHQQRLNQQRLQNRPGQPQAQPQTQPQGQPQAQLAQGMNAQSPQLNQGQMNAPMGQIQQRGQIRQPQMATLTPQERNQLQMLKAAKTAQQQQQLQHLQQQQQQQPQQYPRQMNAQVPGQQSRSNSGSPVMGNTQPLNRANMSKAEYESRLRMVMQKHQQKLQQQQLQQYQNQMSPGGSSPGSASGSGSGSNGGEGSSSN